jgi:hypothetical protein
VTMITALPGPMVPGVTGFPPQPPGSLGNAASILEPRVPAGGSLGRERLRAMRSSVACGADHGAKLALALMGVHDQ